LQQAVDSYSELLVTPSPTVLWPHPKQQSKTSHIKLDQEKSNDMWHLQGRASQQIISEVCNKIVESTE
jgi:hypothetical protein